MNRELVQVIVLIMCTPGFCFPLELLVKYYLICGRSIGRVEAVFRLCLCMGVFFFSFTHFVCVL